MARCTIIGSGLAGCLTAIALHDKGHEVIIHEKMPFPGGISITAGGGVKISNNAKQSFEYLKHTCAGTTSDNILKKFANNMTKIAPWLGSLAKQVGATMKIETKEFLNMPVHHYGFPGWESLELVCITDVPNTNYSTQFPNVKAGTKDGFWGSKGGNYGMNLYKVIYDNVLSRNIKIKFNSRIQQLSQIDSDVKVLACGGYENNNDMKAQYFQGKPVLHNGFEGNTGDGIKMAIKEGADLWHMWNYHGTYGFEVKPGMGARIKGANIWCSTLKNAKSSRPLRHIVVDANGRRFMNEYPPYITDTGHRPLELFNTEEVRYNRIPAYFISDETGRQMGPWASIRANGINATWSDDNKKEIDSGIFTKCNGTKELADYINCNEAILKNTPPPIKYCNEAILKDTITEWNLIANGQKLCPWHRPTKENEQLDKPYYIGKIWPIVGNTQGGPRSNENREVVDPFGEPLGNVYTAGECGSIFGHLYLSAGNFTECFTSAIAISDHVEKLNK